MEELKITRERAIKRMEWILKHEIYCSDKLSHAAINMAITALRSTEPENVRNLLETIHTLRHENANLTTKIERIRSASPASEPLTLEQLRQMDGEPVYVVDIDRKQHYGKYGGYGKISVWGDGSLEDISIDAICEAPYGHTCWEEDSYGKTWLAYARKPEGSENNE